MYGYNDSENWQKKSSSNASHKRHIKGNSFAINNWQPIRKEAQNSQLNMQRSSNRCKRRLNYNDPHKFGTHTDQNKTQSSKELKTINPHSDQNNQI